MFLHDAVHQNKLVTLIPFSEIEKAALDQIEAVLDFESVTKMAIMPDVHMGYTCPIGSVILTEGTIFPAFCGYDIGCGMVNYNTNISVDRFFKNTRQAEKLFVKLKSGLKFGEGIEFAPGTHKYRRFISASGDSVLTQSVDTKISQQLGTLGGGNHFIELGENGNGYLSITIHSGSRNPGWNVGNYYMKIAKASNHALSLNSDLGKAYYDDMLFMQQFALDNRKAILEMILDCLGLDYAESFMINENHNFAVRDGNHMLHRKGATSADQDQPGVIPGSRKSGVYITKGLGNNAFLSSASHGAGRKMSRTKAKEKINLDFEIKNMKGIICDVTKGNLDEADGAYKDLSTVIKYQEGIVIKVIDFIKPLINIK